jgi:hypothetical protein
LELVEAEVVRLDLSRVPIQDLLSSLSRLGDCVAVDDVIPTLPETETSIQVFVKFSRNASASNRQMLESAGLHWHGRDGGWIGYVTPAQLERLRRAFGERVQKPACNPAMPPERLPEAVSADVEAIAASAEEEQGQTATAVTGEQSISTATMKLRPAFGLPRRLT